MNTESQASARTEQEAGSGIAAPALASIEVAAGENVRPRCGCPHNPYDLTNAFSRTIEDLGKLAKSISTKPERGPLFRAGWLLSIAEDQVAALKEFEEAHRGR